MTSRKKRKRTAQQKGLTESELQLCELLEEILAALRWTQVLGWGNQYLLHEKLPVTAEERDRVMRAAAAAVEADAQLRDWGQRLRDIKDKLSAIDAGMRGAGDAAPPAAEPVPEPPAPDGTEAPREAHGDA